MVATDKKGGGRFFNETIGDLCLFLKPKGVEITPHARRVTVQVATEAISSQMLLQKLQMGNGMMKLNFDLQQQVASAKTCVLSAVVCKQ